MGLREQDILAMVRNALPGGETLLDDCGELPASGGGRILVSTDLMEEGTHFQREWHPPRLLGRKLLAVNVSDLDASGAVPIGFTLTLALPADLEPAWLVQFLEGVAEAARDYGVPVLGGDTVGRPAGIGLGATALGRAERWLTRTGVQTGDRLYVDQPLGLSRRGLRRLQLGQRWDATCPDLELSTHLDPRPNIGLGPRLAAIPDVHACIDLSDGLSSDLRRVAAASGCAIVLDAALEPDEIQGGEDYARCFAASLSRAELEARLGTALRQVGEAVAFQGHELLVVREGALQPFPDLGFDHFHP